MDSVADEVLSVLRKLWILADGKRERFSELQREFFGDDAPLIEIDTEYVPALSAEGVTAFLSELKPGEVVRRPVLSMDADSWFPYRGRELLGTLNALDTIRTRIECDFPIPQIGVWGDDLGLFETLTQDIEFLLTDWPELQEAIADHVPTPESLIITDTISYDSEVPGCIYASIDRAKSLVHREMLARGGMDGERLPPFTMFDEELRIRAERNKVEALSARRRLVGPEHDAHDSLQTKETPRRGGRPEGSHYWTIDRIAKLLNKYLASTDDYTKAGFLEFARIPESSFRNAMRREGTNWTTLVQGVDKGS